MKKMSKGMLMTALICGAVYLGGSPVYASELQEFSLDEYVVTAARTETKLVDTPANISVVDAQTIEERHYQDVSEVLKDVPGANVLDSGQGAFEKAISINGDTRVLVLVDGRRVDFASGTSTGRASVDMGLLPDVNMIERIEVLKGAGGALYGSDAVGGVVNIITKKADTNYGKVSVGFGSNGAEDYSVMYSMKSQNTGVTVSASKYEQDYYKYKDIKTDTTKRWLNGSKMDSEKISLKIEQELSPNSNLELGYDYSKYDGLSMSVYDISSNVEKETNNIYAKLNWVHKDTNQGYLQIYHNVFKYYAVQSLSNMLDADVKDETFGIDLQQEVAVSETNKIVFGSSWRDSKVDNVADTYGSFPGNRGDRYDESIDNIAFFVNDTWEVSPTWTLNAGVRYDNHSHSGQETTFSAGINKKFDDNSHAYINWGEVFKAPTTGDLFAVGMGNPNLKAEKGDSWTIGYATKLNDNTNVGINYFENDLEDAINWAEVTPGKWACDNVDKQQKRGFELTVNHELNNNLDVTASYTYIKVENDEGNGYFRDWNYMPNTYRLGLNYHDGKWDTNLWLRAASGGETVSKTHYLDSNYVTVDMSVTYKATKDLSFYAKGYNLFNEAYCEWAGVDYYGSYDYPAQSRRFIVGAEYKF